MSEKSFEAAALDAAEVAWGIIANVSEGDWTKQPQVWQDAAARWRDEHWHPLLDRLTRANPDEPNWGEDEALAAIEVSRLERRL